MPHPFPPLAPPEPAPKARVKLRALPSLPWGEALILLAICLLILQG